MKKGEQEAFQLLGRPIAFNPIFVDWTGKVTSALMLSQLVYWSRRTNNSDGWVYKTAKQWEEEIRLTVKEQRTARERLKGCGLVEEKLKGVPAKLYFRIKTKKFLEMAKSQLSGKGKASFAERVKLELPKGQNKECRKGKTITETTHRLQNKLSANAFADSGSGIFKANGEISKFIKGAADHLEDYVRRTHQIDPKFNKTKGYYQMNLLLQFVQGDKRRLAHVLRTYTGHPHTKHTPQAFCAYSFRKKFLQIESWTNENHPPPPKDEYKVVHTKERIIQ